MKAIINAPGYWIDEDGTVYSTNRTPRGEKRKLSVRNGQVDLFVNKLKRTRKVSDLYMTAYKKILDR